MYNIDAWSGQLDGRIKAGILLLNGLNDVPHEGVLQRVIRRTPRRFERCGLWQIHLRMVSVPLGSLLWQLVHGSTSCDGRLEVDLRYHAELFDDPTSR